tara:strand:+ start:1862 stop:1963 length:102 start_codon:yes stop_codon:yes gene_type:complete
MEMYLSLEGIREWKRRFAVDAMGVNGICYKSFG